MSMRAIKQAQKRAKEISPRQWANEPAHRRIMHLKYVLTPICSEAIARALVHHDGPTAFKVKCQYCPLIADPQFEPVGPCVSNDSFRLYKLLWDFAQNDTQISRVSLAVFWESMVANLSWHADVACFAHPYGKPTPLFN